MPNRILRESILDSEAVNTLTPEGEVFYRRLMSVVDDFGRFDARPAILRSRLYPLRVESMSNEGVLGLLAQCAETSPPLITCYECDGKPYLVLHKLGDPRAKDSKFPPPPEKNEPCAQTQASARARAHKSPYSYSLSNAPTPTPTDSIVGGATASPPTPPTSDEMSQSGIVLVFPVIGKGSKEWRLTQDKLDEWQESYPVLDVLAECKRAKVWISANGMKTAGGMDRFLVSWLNRSVNSGHRGGVQNGRTGADLGQTSRLRAEPGKYDRVAKHVHVTAPATNGTENGGTAGKAATVDANT